MFRKKRASAVSIIGGAAGNKKVIKRLRGSVNAKRLGLGGNRKADRK